MSADDFQTKYSSVMESMLKSAIAETTKLFETMVDELKAEISRIKKENEDLKTRCGRFESAKSRPTVYGGDSDASEKRDAAVQCDLAPFRMMLVGQRQPLKHSSQNQKKQCGYEEIDYTLLDHNYETQEEGNSQMAFVLVEQESVRGHEGIGSTVVHQPVLSNKPDSPWVCACGTENEGPVINKASDMLVLSSDICPNSKETFASVSLHTSQLSGEPKDGQEKARSSSENGIISEALLNTPCVQPSKPSEVFEKSTAAITTAEPTAVPVTTGETASYLDKEIIGVAVQACEGADDQPIEENQSAALQHLTSVTFKDMSDPHLQMTKTQFLAQLAVSPVTHNLKKTSSRDSADTEASSAETSTSGKRRPQKHSLMAQLRDHIKSHLQARETETNEEPHTEKETCSVSLKNARFENDHPDDKNTAGEPFPLCQKTPGAIEDVTTLKNTPNDPPHISLRRLGLCKDGVKPTRTASKSSFVSSRRSKATIESTPLGPRRSCSGRDSGESTAKKTIPVSPRTSSSTEERATPEMTQNTSVRLMRSSLRRDGVSPKSTTTNSSPDNSKTASVRPKRSSSGRKTECSSVGPRTSGIIKSTDGVGTKINTESTSVKKPRLIQDHTSPKKNLRVVNAKKLAKAAKAKTIAKIKKSNQLHHGGKTRQLAESGGSCEAVDKRAAKTVWTPRLPANKTPPAHLPAKRETRSQDHAIVYPPSDSHNPVSVKAPAVISPLQPLSVIGRHLLKNQCGECGRVLSSSAALESHVSLHTGRRPFSCTLCGKRFPDSKGLKRHGRVHRNGRIHICEQCGKGFVYRFSLTKHVQMVHGRIKPFVCQVCNKGFFTKRDVEAHIRIHTGEKPFHCNLCDKKFTRRVELNVHLRWHNGEKRHWCPFCGKGFLDFNNLKRHKYIHTGEKPHSCPHCPKNFTQSGHLKKHVKCVHKIQ